MKLETTPVKIDSAGDIKESSFGISRDDQAHILVILRDKLYSDKIYAVIREYSTNALDAHASIGKSDQPIQITLPSKLDLHFKVRDFGPGLSEEEVRELYVMYGASTRRSSNDVIGQLGLGCKSGFAYGNSFIVTSYHDGMKYIYNAYIDESNIGKIALMGQPTPSVEPNGIEVTIPVRNEDCGAFREKAIKMYCHFKTRPIVNGCKEYLARIKEFDDSLTLSGSSKVPGLATTSWSLHSNSNGPTAIMGNIPYPIKTDIEGLDVTDRRLLDTNINIEFDIGDLAVAASREALEYTKPTVERLKKRFQSVHETIIADMQKKIADAPNLLEAKATYIKIFQAQNWSISQYFNALRNKIDFSWKNFDATAPILSTGNLKLYDPKKKTHKDIEIDAKMYLCQETWKRRGSGVTFSIAERDTINNHEISAGDNLIIVEVDTQDRWVKRAEALYYEYVDAGKKPRMFAIKVEDAAVRKQLVEYFGYDKLNVKLISSVEPLAKPRNPTAGTHKEKHKTHVFELDWKEYGSHHSVRSKFWKKAEADLENDDHLYVELDSFFVKLKYKNADGNDAVLQAQMYQFKEWIKILKGIGIDAEKDKLKIYGVKTKLMPKIGKDWVRFEDFVFQKIRDYEAKTHTILKHNDALAASDHMNENIEKLVKNMSKIKDRDSALIKYLEAYIRAKKNAPADMKRSKYSGSYRNTTDFIRFVSTRTDMIKTIGTSENLEELSEKAINECPIFKAFHVLWCKPGKYGSGYPDEIEDVTSLIEMFNVYMEKK